MKCSVIQSRRWIATVITTAIAIAAQTTHAQSLLTVAGGRDDDGRPAIAATLVAPMDVVVDPEGNVFVRDGDTNRVRRISARTGIITTYAGQGRVACAAGDGALVGDLAISIAALAMSPDGRLHIAADCGLLIMDTGTGIARIHRDVFAQGLAVGPNGVVFYVPTGQTRQVLSYDAATRQKVLIAGNGKAEQLNVPGPDGVATEVRLNLPAGLAVNPTGTFLYIADLHDNRIRAVNLQTGMMTTVGGSGAVCEATFNVCPFTEDGQPATQTAIANPMDVEVDAAGNIYLFESKANRIRMIGAQTRIVTTVAGTGVARWEDSQFSGDDGPATLALMSLPRGGGLAVDQQGRVLISSRNNRRVRRVEPDRTIHTIGGNGSAYSGDGDRALNAAFGSPNSIAFDGKGGMYIGDGPFCVVRRLDLQTGKIETVAGNGRNDIAASEGVSAKQAPLAYPEGITVGPDGALYIAETLRLKRVDPDTGIIRNVAGNGAVQPYIDGRAARATPCGPSDAVVDSAGNIYIADFQFSRIRKITPDGVMRTIAGNGGDSGPVPDGSLALEVPIGQPQSIALDPESNVYFASRQGFFRVDSAGAIHRAAGGGTRICDRCPALEAKLDDPGSINIDANGHLYISTRNAVFRVDRQTGLLEALTCSIGPCATSTAGAEALKTTVSSNAYPGYTTEAIRADDGSVYISNGAEHRVDVIRPCVSVSAPVLSAPANGSSGALTSPSLTWSAVRGAFGYDVYLDTRNPPERVVATDVATNADSPSNLEPLTTYYWRVVAKGDPFCATVSTAESEVFSFTTRGVCGLPGAFPTSTADSYDTYFGTSNPPRLYAAAGK